jgi:hypothetical protein
MIHYFLVILLFPITAQAVIITVDQVQNTKMPELPTKKFILYGDHHDSSPEDPKQLEGLTQALIRRDRESDEKIHFLIEEPATIPYSSVLGGLLDTIMCRGLFRNTTIENIEIRNKAKAALALFWPKRKFPIGHASSYNHTVDHYGDVTMADVESEITHHKAIIDDWHASTDLRYTGYFSDHEGEYQYYLSEFKRISSAFSIAPDDNIVDIYEHFEKNTPQRIGTLFKALEHLTSLLFDLHIAKYLVTPKAAQTIGLIAGASHTSMAYGFLDRLRNRTLACYGSRSHLTVEPLAVKYLDPDYSPCSCLAPCITFLDRYYSPCHCYPSCIMQ